MFAAAGAYDRIDAQTGVAVYGGYDPTTWQRSPQLTTTITGTPQGFFLAGDKNVLLQLLTVRDSRLRIERLRIPGDQRLRLEPATRHRHRCWRPGRSGRAGRRERRFGRPGAGRARRHLRRLDFGWQQGPAARALPAGWGETAGQAATPTSFRASATASPDGPSADGTAGASAGRTVIRASSVRTANPARTAPPDPPAPAERPRRPGSPGSGRTGQPARPARQATAVAGAAAAAARTDSSSARRRQRRRRRRRGGPAGERRPGRRLGRWVVRRLPLLLDVDRSDSSSIKAGNGGAGGPGGAGGRAASRVQGDPGGSTCTSEIGAGGNGGTGGPGGHGGGGGGGLGGPSIGVFKAGTSTATVTGSTVLHGAAGAGGIGGGISPVQGATAGRGSRRRFMRSDSEQGRRLAERGGRKVLGDWAAVCLDGGATLHRCPACNAAFSSVFRGRLRGVRRATAGRRSCSAVPIRRKAKGGSERPQDGLGLLARSPRRSRPPADRRGDRAGPWPASNGCSSDVPALERCARRGRRRRPAGSGHGSGSSPGSSVEEPVADRPRRAAGEARRHHRVRLDRAQRAPPGRPGAVAASRASRNRVPIWAPAAPSASAAANPRPSTIPPVATTGTVHRVDDLRHQRDRPDERHARRDVERRAMPARLGALRDRRSRRPRPPPAPPPRRSSPSRRPAHPQADEPRRVAQGECQHRARLRAGRPRPARRPGSLRPRRSRGPGGSPSSARNGSIAACTASTSPPDARLDDQEVDAERGVGRGLHGAHAIARSSAVRRRVPAPAETIPKRRRPRDTAATSSGVVGPPRHRRQRAMRVLRCRGACVSARRSQHATRESRRSGSP